MMISSCVHSIFRHARRNSIVTPIARQGCSGASAPDPLWHLKGTFHQIRAAWTTAPIQTGQQSHENSDVVSSGLSPLQIRLKCCLNHSPGHHDEMLAHGRALAIPWRQFVNELSSMRELVRFIFQSDDKLMASIWRCSRIHGLRG